MFERYFCSRVVARLRASRDAGWLASFVDALHSRGHARLSVQNYVREAELFGLWLRRRRRSLSSVTDDDVRTFASRPPLRYLRRTTFAAGCRLLSHLRARGLVPHRASRVSANIESVITSFDTYLHDVVGMAPATRLYSRRYATEFLHSIFDDKPIRWDCLRVEHIRSFVAGYGQTGRIASAQVAGGAIRTLLRWLQFHGWIGSDLLAAVPHYPRWRLAVLPRVLTDQQLDAILASFDRAAPVGRRDYAMAVCMIDLGLRVGDVADLSLVNVDLTNGILYLGAGKPRRARTLPLPDRVRQAIQGYIHGGRPPTSDQHLFVRHRLPIGTAVSREVVRAVIRRAYAAVPGCEHLTGTHILRHTIASRLLRAGADLKRIADILGHRSIDTTAIYTKIDDERLAAVAMPWPTIKEVRS
jgi:integrase/recombinase XerD